jgi:hypothetical protein
MEAHEVLRRVFKKYGLKNVARELGLGKSTLERWSRPRGNRGTGMVNPLERVEAVARVTHDRQLAEFVCQATDGFYVPNPPAGKKPAGAVELTAAEHAVQRSLGDFEQAMMDALERPASRARVEQLRASWDALKAGGERLVRALEGHGAPSMLAA